MYSIDTLTDSIIAKLKEITVLEEVYYGSIPANITLNKYNYCVVMQARPNVTDSSWTDRYRIAIVMENGIPIKFIRETVIPKLKTLGLKFEPDTIENPEFSIPSQTSMRLQANVFYVSAKPVRWCQ